MHGQSKATFVMADIKSRFSAIAAMHSWMRPILGQEQFLVRIVSGGSALGLCR